MLVVVVVGLIAAAQDACQQPAVPACLGREEEKEDGRCQPDQQQRQQQQ